MKNIRIGHGYDVHKLVQGRDFILGGVKIMHETGLLGHSDADVLLHSIMDSLLGAACLGDIGLHFPDNDNQYKGISSIELLKQVNALIHEKNFSIINIDSTILAQAPKLRPYIDDMRKNISIALNIDLDCINIKATTEEGLGFTGEKLGIAVHSVCLLNKEIINI